MEVLKSRLSRNNPPSIIDKVGIHQVRQKYLLSQSMALRPPLDNERATNAGLNEIVIYKAFFALGLRDKISLLIVEIPQYFKVSPGCSPHQFGELLFLCRFLGSYSIDFRVDKVLCAYYFKPLPTDARRYSIYL